MRLVSSLCILILIFGYGAELRTLSVQHNEFTSSDVADAAEKLTGRRAHMASEIRMLAGKRLSGPAITLRIVKDEKASSTAEGLAVIKVMEEAPPGSVVVASLEDNKDFAVFGATFAALAKSRKLGGFVVDGPMRGWPALIRIAVPIFARGTASGSAGGHYRLEGINVPATCGGIQVMPGDFVVGDEDGVAVAPKELYQEILVKAKELRDEKEALLPLIEKYGSYTKAVQELNARKRLP